MSVVVVTPPASIVDLALVKKQLRVDYSDDDDLIAIHLAAAQASLDGPSGWLERAVGLQTLELRQDGFYADDWRVGGHYAWEEGWGTSNIYDGLYGGTYGLAGGHGRWPFSRRIQLPYPPFVSVTSITYEDGSGVDQVLTPTGWEASDEGVEPAFGTSWPSGRVDANAVRIRYQAGYPNDANGNSTVPRPIVAAVLMITTSLYANREADVIDARAVVAANPAVESLLSPFRVWQP